MKTLKKIGCMLTAMCLCFSMVSCSEDGDGPSGDSGSVKLGTKNFDTPYGFWHSGGQDTEELEDNTILMEFYSFNPAAGKFPSKASVVTIDYKVPAGQNEITSTVVKGGEYNIYVAHNFTMSSPGLQCETTDDDASSPDLIIERNGSKYSISINGAKVSNESNSYDFSFNFSGELTNMQIAQ